MQRYLLTRLGPIRFSRWKVRDEDGYHFPLDRALGIGSREQASEWVRKQACWLAQAHPFRVAARLLSELALGTEGRSHTHDRMGRYGCTSTRAIRLQPGTGRAIA